MTGRELIYSVALSKAGHAYVRVRNPKWANQHAYLRLSVLLNSDDGMPTRCLGPWAHLYDRPTQEVIGVETPQQILTLMPPFDYNGFLTEEVDLFTGDLDPDDQ
jgi:hypothetical protein